MAKSIWKKMIRWASGSGTESRRFPGHDVVKLLHEGEKGFVYQARALKSDMLVVIKVYKPLYNRTVRRMCKRYHLRREGEIGMLINPCSSETTVGWPIVRTLSQGYEFGDSTRCYYLILEYIDGINVKHLLGCEDPLLRQLRLPIARTVARALSIIHKRELVHRDVCTDNIMVTRGHDVRLIDLGFMAPTGIAFREKSGTPSYMSPDQCQAQPIEAASDIYSFGVLLFELFTTKLPFTTVLPAYKPELSMRRAAELMAQHVRDKPPRPSEITSDMPAGMEPLILKCLEKKPQDRHQDMRALMGELARMHDDVK